MTELLVMVHHLVDFQLFEFWQFPLCLSFRYGYFTELPESCQLWDHEKLASCQKLSICEAAGNFLSLTC